MNVDREGRRAILPEWYFAAPYGQPRKINAIEIRDLARTPFIHLCTTTIIEDFASTPWDVVSKNRDVINQSHIDEIKEFLKLPNKNKETINDLQRQWARDVLELDAGVIVKVFDESSYEGKSTDFETTEHKYFKSEGKESEFKKDVTVKMTMKKLKRRITKDDFEELNKQTAKQREYRKLKEIYVRDGSTFLKDGDYTGFVHRYYQYSFKIPLRTPTIFDRDEIVYSMKCPTSYGFYGWSPIQSLEDLVRTLKEQIINFLALAKEKSVPDGIISVLDISDLELKRLREYWRKEIKGKAHKFAVIGREAKFTPTIITPRDMEFLASQQWFMRLVMACFNLNIPVLSLRGEAPKAGTWAMMRRERHKAIVPLLQLFEDEMNTEIIIEFGYDDVEFKFQTYDIEEDQMKRNMQIADLNAGITTINEVRTEERGQDEVPWGTEPFSLGVHALQTGGFPMTQFPKSLEKVPTLEEFKERLMKVK